MTAHCRPEYPDDFDIEAQVIMTITAIKGQGTAVAREIADHLREFVATRVPPPLPLVADAPPANHRRK
jgi:hypothetical protein